MFEGGCDCRAVRYRMASRPLFVHCCHCRWCQRETGSAFAINAMIEADRVVLLQGEPEIVHTPSASGKGQEIARCPACRIALWSNYAGVLPPGTPAVPEYYDRRNYWPRESLERREALLARQRGRG